MLSKISWSQQTNTVRFKKNAEPRFKIIHVLNYMCMFMCVYICVFLGHKTRKRIRGGERYIWRRWKVKKNNRMLILGKQKGTNWGEMGNQLVEEGTAEGSEGGEHTRTKYSNAYVRTYHDANSLLCMLILKINFKKVFGASQNGRTSWGPSVRHMRLWKAFHIQAAGCAVEISEWRTEWID